jgi:hypothetical protein
MAWHSRKKQGAICPVPSLLLALPPLGIARVNTESMVKPLGGPYNNLHYAALASMLQGEELANTRAVRCQR